MSAQKYSLETELDKSIEALAETKARCQYLLASGAHSEGQCSWCKTRYYFEQSIAALQPVDVLRVENRAMQLLSGYFAAAAKARADARQNSKINLSLKQVFKYLGIAAIIFIFFTVGMGLLPILFFKFPTQQLYNNAGELYGKSRPPIIKEDTDIDLDDIFMIDELVKETELCVSDRNRDGTINCIDYTLTFKELYDESHGVLEHDYCEIVRNVNEAQDFNHLFVRIKGFKGKWIYVEPQYSICNADNFGIYKWGMRYVWGDRYNPRYNIYGETKYWLKRKVQ